jgi:hypothetical protein
VTTPAGPTPEQHLAGHPLALAVFARVRDILEASGPVAMRVSKSQIAFRRERGFAYLWLPGRYLARPGADVVLSIALGGRDPSPRWKQVVEPVPGQWMHHLEIEDVADVDDEVATWLREAADRAGPGA